MLTARFFNAAGEPGDAVQLPEELFDGVVNDAVLHQVPSHYALVYLKTGAEDQPLARLQSPTTAVVIAEPAPPSDPVMEQKVFSGMTAEQIALLFLVMALLIALRGFRSEWAQRKRKK